MGTNFYARILPKKERKEHLKRLIDEDKFREIKDEVQEMYGNVDDYCLEGSIIHIGKRSGGWKFLWNSNWRIVNEGEWNSETKTFTDKWVVKKFYDLTKKSLKEFLSRDDIEMFDEYGDYVDAKTFVDDMVSYDNEPWINGEEKFDGERYDKKENGGYEHWVNKEEIEKWRKIGITISHHEFYSDGLRFSSSTDFS